MINYSGVFKVLLARIKYELREAGRSAGYATRR
jgi:hypothetical protein